MRGELGSGNTRRSTSRTYGSAQILTSQRGRQCLQALSQPPAVPKKESSAKRNLRRGRAAGIVLWIDATPRSWWRMTRSGEKERDYGRYKVSTSARDKFMARQISSSCTTLRTSEK